MTDRDWQTSRTLVHVQLVFDDYTQFLVCHSERFWNPPEFMPGNTLSQSQTTLICRRLSGLYRSLPGSSGGLKPPRSDTALLVRVSIRVVVVVAVRELFSLVTSAICVRIKGRGQRLRRLFTTWLKFFVYCCVLGSEFVGTIWLYFAMQTLNFYFSL